jgi:DNA segregation ATPase FtsK/SpoIIIE-like protein
VVGLNLDELEKHDRDLALALASPTGKVKMIIPIPGRSLVGIQVPKMPKEELLLREKQNKEKKINNTWRNVVADIFMLIGYIFFSS